MVHILIRMAGAGFPDPWLQKNRHINTICKCSILSNEPKEEKAF
jgi:hypothetical protein